MTAYACLRYRDADAALELLQAAFGFEPEAVHHGDTGRVEHARVRAGKSLIYPATSPRSISTATNGTSERTSRRLSPATVVGPSTRPFVLEKARRYETLGVVFKPGAALAMLGCSADELRERRVPLADVWEANGAELRERVVAASGPHQKLAEAEHVLSARLTHTDRRPDSTVARAAARIAGAPERCGIGCLSEVLGISRRRLEENFRACVGVTPKEYQRLQRFRQALERIDSALDLGWAAFALECGYYDQSHFNNEFRVHAGLCPSEYLAARGVFTNHVPLQAAG